MLKILSILLLTTLSPLALADYFTCHLEVNYFQKYSAEAPYRGRELTLEGSNFKCLGSIQGDQIVTELVSLETGESTQSSGKGSSEVYLRALDQHGDGLDQAYCKCGME